MYYDPGRHNGEQQAAQNEAGFVRHADDERKLPFNSMKSAAQARSERETQRIMDGLFVSAWNASWKPDPEKRAAARRIFCPSTRRPRDGRPR